MSSTNHKNQISEGYIWYLASGETSFYLKEKIFFNKISYKFAANQQTGITLLHDINEPSSGIYRMPFPTELLKCQLEIYERYS